MLKKFLSTQIFDKCPQNLNNYHQVTCKILGILDYFPTSFLGFLRYKELCQTLNPKPKK